MKIRYMLFAGSLAFAITLAMLIGQRLSAEAMAVILGVVSGVAASIPTSLIVVWFALRSSGNSFPSTESRRASVEPRIVVVSQPAPSHPYAPPPGAHYLQPMPPALQAGYGAPAYPMYAGYAPPTLAPRRFTVIGGSEVLLEEADPPQEVVWQR